MRINSNTLSKEQVLIVGCGDIGERLAKALPDTYQVTGLRRTPPANLAYLQYIACDATDARQLDKVIQQHVFDVIIVSMTPSERSDAGYERAYVQTCRNLVASLRTQPHQPRLVLLVSSTGVYGQDDGSWVDENSPTEPTSFSGKRLLEAEKIIQNSALATLIVRFSGIYGPNRNRLIEMVRGKRASLSPQITNRIHADDCAAALAHLVEQHHHGKLLDRIYIATDSAPTPMAEVLTWLAQQMGMSDFASNTQINEGGNKACSNQRLLATGFQLRYPSYREGYAAMLAAPPPLS